VLALALVGGITTWIAVSNDDTNSASTPATTGCRASVVAASGTPASGDAATAFTLPGLDGGCVRLADLRGKPVVINFWASWCHPCRQEFPLLRRTFNEHRGQGLEIVGVSFQDIASDARRFARDHHADWLLAFDDSGDVAKAYGIRPVPQTLFVRRDGVVSARIYGPLSAHDLRIELAKILAP
jgi:cytochrome c biogenesis protein CcmG/thiol:disulfide interchange protein DsbE